MEKIKGEKELWLGMWDEGRTHFHNSQYNPHLIKHYPTLEKKEHQVFIPLCGKSLDILFFLERGHQVMGVELAPMALEQFFNEQKIPPQISTQANHTLYQAPGLKLYLGDLFELNAKDLEQANFIYDRASLVALPLELRQSYYHLLCERTVSGCEMLLINFEHDYPEIEGPPHCVLISEIKEYLGQDFEITVLETLDKKIESPRLQNQGAIVAREAVIYLKKKS